MNQKTKQKKEATQVDEKLGPKRNQETGRDVQTPQNKALQVDRGTLEETPATEGTGKGSKGAGKSEPKNSPRTCRGYRCRSRATAWGLRESGRGGS